MHLLKERLIQHLWKGLHILSWVSFRTLGWHLVSNRINLSSSVGLTAQGHPESLLAVKKSGSKDKSGTGSAGRYFFLSFLCSGYPDATTYSHPIPRPDFTACVTKSLLSLRFPAASAPIWVLSLDSLSSIPILVLTLPRTNEAFLVSHLFALTLSSFPFPSPFRSPSPVPPLLPALFPILPCNNPLFLLSVFFLTP